MTFDPFLDEPPDTRHDAPTKRAIEGFFADEAASSDGPATRAMSPDERNVALLGPATGRYEGAVGAWDDAPAERVLPPADDSQDDDVESVEAAGPWLRSDRKTLPSARFPHPGEGPLGARHFADLGWENMASAEESGAAAPREDDADLDAEDASSSSIWGRVQQFVAGLGKKRAAPSPSASHARTTARAVAELLWTMEDADLEVIATHIEHVVSLRQLGPDAYAEGRILDALGSLESADRASGGITLTALRGHIPEVSRNVLDAALLRLEERRSVALAPAEDMPERDALRDPKRGLLGRCAILSPTMGGSRS